MLRILITLVDYFRFVAFLLFYQTEVHFDVNTMHSNSCDLISGPLKKASIKSVNSEDMAQGVDNAGVNAKWTDQKSQIPRAAAGRQILAGSALSDFVGSFMGKQLLICPS